MKKTKYLILGYTAVFAIAFNMVPIKASADMTIVSSSNLQSLTIKGKIMDNSGQPIPGASVQIKGTNIGAATNSNGEYSIIVPEANVKGTLVISSIGFIMKEVSIANKTTINVVLESDDKGLDEVIVVGYGTQKRRDVVGSISKIKSEDITKVPTASFADALQGQASGLFVSSPSGHPGAAPEIKIRGKGSINLGSSPLFIVDGVPITTGSQDLSRNGTKSVSPLAMINPNDIESVEILKDAAATAIYGNRGSNGVIIVTTKSAKSGKTTMSITYDGGISQLPYGQNDIYMDNNEYWATVDKAWTNAGNTTPFDPNKIIISQFIDEKPVMTREEALRTNTDHLGAMTQSAGFNQVGLGVTKGFENGGLVFSTNYRDEKGLLLNNNLQRLTSRFNFNFSPIKDVKMGVNVSLLYLKTNGVQSGNGKGFGGWANWAAMMPFFKLYDPNSATGYWAANSGFNGLAYADDKLIRNHTDEYRSISNVFLQWDTPVKGLSLRTEGGVDLGINNGSYWRSIYLDGNAPFNNEAAEQSVTQHVFNYNAFLNYNRTSGDHSFGATAGAEATRQSGYKRSVEGTQINSTYPELRDPIQLTNGDGLTFGQQYLMGLFGRANYSYKNRYILNASVRRDGHSVLSKHNRWATFAAVGAGWIITDEKFMNVSWLNLLKLRGSYGTTGNTGLSDEMIQLNIGTSPNRYGGGYLPGGTTLGPVGSPGLRWETTTSTDVGFDFGILENRISGSVAYYTKDVSDLILRGNVPISTGFTNNAVWENIGDLRNWGWEFDVTSLNIKSNSFSWNTDFNISFNDNKIIRLNEFEKGKGAESAQVIRKEGEKLDTWYLADFVEIDKHKGIPMIEQRDANIWNTQFRTVGNGNLVPMNSANVEANKMIHSGKTALPTFFGGLTNRFTYKSFDMNIMLAFAGGNYKINSVYERGRRISDVSNVVKVDGKVWEKDGDIAKYPMLRYGNSYNFDNNGNPISGTTNFETANNNFWLEKADYIRLRNVQIGYTLPASVVSKLRMQNLRVYVGGMNLLTFTNYTGLDPETNADLTTPRNFNFGLSLTL